MPEYLKFALIFLMMVRIVFAMGWRPRRGQPVTQDGETFHVSVGRDKSKGVTLVEISVDMPDRFRFTLRPENAVDRFAQKIGIAREWQTGDEQFDSAVFIVSDDQVLLEALSTDPLLRSAALTLLQFQSGGKLESSRGRLSFAVRPSEKHRSISNDFVRQLFAQELHAPLTRFRERLMRMAVGDWQSDRDPGLRRRTWLLGIIALLTLAGAIGFIAELRLERLQVVREAIPHLGFCALAAAAVVLLLSAFAWFGRTSRTHMVLLDMLLVALPSVWFAASGGLTWYNEHYDVSPPLRFAAKVESTYTTKFRNSTTYHLVVEKWPDERGVRDVVIRQREMEGFDGNCVFAIWHSGRLGDGWVSSFERAGEQDCIGGKIE